MRPPLATACAPKSGRQCHSIDLGAAGFAAARTPASPSMCLSSADWDDLLPDELLQDPCADLEAALACLLAPPGPMSSH